MLKIKNLVPLLITVLLFCVQTAYAKPQSFQNVIVFGDGFIDAGDIQNQEKDYAGNNDWFVLEGKDDVIAPAGAPVTNTENNDPKSPRPLWVNFFLEELQFDNNSNRIYTYRELKDEDLAGKKVDPKQDHVNYAWLSAETGDLYLDDSDPEGNFPVANEGCDRPGFTGAAHTACVPGVMKQVQLYLNDVKRKPNQQTLYLFWAGSNDVLNNLNKLLYANDDDENSDVVYKKVENLMLGSLSPTPQVKLPEDTSTPVKNMISAVQQLLSNGVSADQIYVLNLPNLAQTPIAGIVLGDDAALIDLLDKSITVYNKNLLIGLTMDNKLIPKENVFSAEQEFSKIIAEPAFYHLKNAKNDCIEDGKGPNCKGYVFFKGKSPTTFVGKVVAKSLAANINQNLSQE